VARVVRRKVRRARRLAAGYGERLLAPVGVPLVAAVQRRRGTLSPENVLAQYRAGRFPGAGAFGRRIWCEPKERALVPVVDRHIPRSVARLMRSGRFEIRFDTAFAEVVDHCATVQGRSAGAHPWLTPQLRDTYVELHRRGIAHSVEAWRDGRLVGGEFGVCINGFYTADSTFHLEPNAGKVAFAHVLEHLAERGITLYDCQELSGATVPFGAYTVSRQEYRRMLRQALDTPATFR
jgi:leucyl/phenylalanyl-tRNA---protein transferase